MSPCPRTDRNRVVFFCTGTTCTSVSGVWFVALDSSLLTGKANLCDVCLDRALGRVAGAVLARLFNNWQAAIVRRVARGVTPRSF